MNHMNELQQANRKLFMELNLLNAADPDYEAKHKAIADKIRANNRDMTAFADALGNEDQQSRLYRYRK